MIASVLETHVTANPDQDDVVATLHSLSFGQQALHSIVVPLPIQPDPIAFLQHASAALGDGVLWSQGETGKCFAGAGVAAEFVGEGRERFARAGDALRDLAQSVDDRSTLPFPVLGGFAFSPTSPEDSIWRDFPSARLLVPRVLLQIADGAAFLRVTLPTLPHTSPENVAASLSAQVADAQAWTLRPSGRSPLPSSIHRSIPDRVIWEQSVTDAVAAIQRGEVAKMVLAREEQLTSDHDFSAIAALNQLRHANQTAALFAMQCGPSWFLGATPERLVRLIERRVDITCLAGSIAIGDSDEERVALAAQLMASQKDREEHEIVVDSTIEALSGLCTEITRVAQTPRVMTARSVQHLQTPLVANAALGVSVLDLVERLHPTPAVGGYPRREALAAIERLEEIDRGWYAGPFGWLDLRGEGEFSVAIRSALLTGRVATAYAGCGIVAASNSAAEYRETELKLRPMLSALGAA